MKKIIAIANTQNNTVCLNHISAYIGESVGDKKVFNQHILPVSALMNLFDKNDGEIVDLPFKRIPSNWGAIFELSNNKWFIDNSDNNVKISDVSGVSQSYVLQWEGSKTFGLYTGNAMVFICMAQENGNSYLKSAVFDGQSLMEFPLIELDNFPKKACPQLNGFASAKAHYDPDTQQLTLSVYLTYKVKKKINSRISHNTVFMTDFQVSPDSDECKIVRETPAPTNINKRPDITNPAITLNTAANFRVNGTKLYSLYAKVPLFQHFHLFSQVALMDDEIITVFEKLEKLKESHPDNFDLVYNHYHAIVLDV